MKKVLSLILVLVLVAGGLFVLTGCEQGKTNNNKVEISQVIGKETDAISIA